MSVASEDTRERVARAIFDEGKQALEIPERQSWEETDIGPQVFCLSLADAALAVVSPSPVDAAQPVCKVCGDEKILMEPDGSNAQPCYACQPAGTTLEQASRPRAAAPPVGVDEDARARAIAEHVARKFSVPDLDANPQGAEFLEMIQEGLAATRPSSAAPGVTEGLREAAHELFNANYHLHRQHDHVRWASAKIRLETAWRAFGSALAASPGLTPDHEKELRERMGLIERFAKTVADSHCEHCEGDGIDEEGAEWTLCECVLSYLRTSERVSPAPTEGPDDV